MAEGTIVLASMVSLWVVGLRKVGKASRWSLTAVGILMLAIVALGGSLSVRSDDHPHAERLPVELMTAMQAHLGADFRLASVAVAYDELGVQLNVRVLGKTLASKAVAHEIRALTREYFNAPVRVRLITEVPAEHESELAPAR